MKLIQRLTLLSSLALLAGACDLQQIFDERIDDKQLLVLTPDFADTSVQLVFRDPETLAVLDEDFEVTVYSNKRLVDLNGNYKNQFIARGGVMEFSVSPEETVTESDPLQIGVMGTSLDNTKAVIFTELNYRTKGVHTSLITPSTVPILDETAIDSGNALDKSRSQDSQLPGSAEEIKLRLEFNGQEISSGSSAAINGVRIYDYSSLFSGLTTSYQREAGFIILGYSAESSFTNLDQIFALDPSRVTEADRLLSDFTISVKGAGRELVDYDFQIFYFSSYDKDRIVYEIDQDGNYVIRRRPKDSVNALEFFLNEEVRSSFFPNYLHEVSVPISSFFRLATLSYWKKSDYKVCAQGFNLSFEGAPSDADLNLLYKATRDTDKQLFTFASFNVNAASSRYNSLQDGGTNKHVIAVEGNKLEFAENSQYIIEPQVIDLGGEELCGNTYTVRLKRRDTHKKHQLNLSMRNENQNVGLALTFSALLRKQGQDNASWETVNFKQGSTSLFLEEGSTYEVKLTLADEPFEFTFTNDLSLVEAAVQATLRNVTRIKDIKYSISESAEANTIDAEIVFYQGQSLID